MTLGRALFLLILMVTAFFGLSVKEHREAITLWDAKVADLRRQLVAARDELGRLQYQLVTASSHHHDTQNDQDVSVSLHNDLAAARTETDQLRHEVARHLEDIRRAEHDRNRTAALHREALAQERDMLAAVSRDLAFARNEIEGLKQELAKKELASALPATEGKVVEPARELADASEQIGALSRELSLAQEEIQRTKDQSALAIEQANKKARERSANLSRDLRAARKEILRLTKESEPGEPGG